MLRNFLYLNESMLNSFLGVIEGGLSDEVRRKTSQRGKKAGHGGVNVKVADAKFGGERETTEEDETVVRDTPELRFDRLMSALDADPESWTYEEVLDLNEAFARLTPGTLITVDCEVEVPPAISVLAQPDQLNKMLDLVEIFGPMASAFGGSAEGLPDADQIKAARSFTQIEADLVIVGEVDGNSPKIAGKLERGSVREFPEGDVRVFGKVAKKWSLGESHSLLALPGATLMSRSQRRSSKPSKPDDANMLYGPAITLDVLAVYR